MFTFQFLSDKIYSYIKKSRFSTWQFGKTGVLVNFITQKLKSRHLAISVFSGQRFFWGDERKYFPHISGLSVFKRTIPSVYQHLILTVQAGVVLGWVTLTLNPYSNKYFLMWLLTQNAPLNIEDMRRDFTREFPYVLLMRRVVVRWGETLWLFWYNIIQKKRYLSHSVQK